MIRNKYVKNNISKKLLITNIVFTCAMMLIILLDYIFVCNREELNAKNLNVFRQNNIYESLNNETDRLKALCMELGNDSRVYSLVNLSAYNRNSFILDMKNKIDVISKSFPYKVDFYINLQDTGDIIGKEGIIEDDIFYKVIDQKIIIHTLYMVI